MKTDPSIHTRNHLIKNWLGKAESFLGAGPTKDELIVINYHGTQRKFLSELKSQVERFRKKYTIIGPDDLDSFYQEKLKPADRPFLLMTFDDGIKNNLLAADLLDQYDIKAFFFVIPDFINTAEADQKNYFTHFIRPKINPSIDAEKEDFSAMTWSDLDDLSKRGHKIGSHTLSHRLVAKNSTAENSAMEICDSRILIAKKLDVPMEKIDSFCSINNTLESVGAIELELIKKNYNFHFTTIPGTNTVQSDPYFIRRCNIETHWLEGTVKYAMGKWDLKRWRAAELKYASLLSGKKN